MDPVSLMMLAQAGISITGNIINTFGGISNADVKKKRAREAYGFQKEQIANQRDQLDTSKNRAVADITASSSSDIASRIQSGQMGPQGQAVNQANTDLSTSRLYEDFNSSNKQINLQEKQIQTDYQNNVSDLEASKSAAVTNLLLGTAGTALGTAANITDRMNTVKSQNEQLNLVNNNYGQELNRPATSIPESPLIYPQQNSETSNSFNLFNGGFGQYAPKTKQRPYSIYKNY